MHGVESAWCSAACCPESILLDLLLNLMNNSNLCTARIYYLKFIDISLGYPSEGNVLYENAGVG